MIFGRLDMRETLPLHLLCLDTPGRREQQPLLYGLALQVQEASYHTHLPNLPSCSKALPSRLNPFRLPLFWRPQCRAFSTTLLLP